MGSIHGVEGGTSESHQENINVVIVIDTLVTMGELQGTHMLETWSIHTQCV